MILAPSADFLNNVVLRPNRIGVVVVKSGKPIGRYLMHQRGFPDFIVH